MKTLKILLAATLAALATTAIAAPGGPGCPQGATPGSAECAGRGAKGIERFKAADKNGDGLISLAEAQAAMPRVASNFDAIDANKDGQLTHEELRAFGQAQRGQRGSRGEGWKKFDADGDGKLSRAEVANAPRLSQAFDTIDADKDGFLTPAELQAAHGRHAGKGAPRS